MQKIKILTYKESKALIVSCKKEIQTLYLQDNYSAKQIADILDVFFDNNFAKALLRVFGKKAKTNRSYVGRNRKPVFTQNSTDILNKIKDQCKIKKYDYLTLAKKTGISDYLIVKFLNGNHDIPFNDFLKIIDVLDFKITVK